jgi:hypothetical protein
MKKIIERKTLVRTVPSTSIEELEAALSVLTEATGFTGNDRDIQRQKDQMRLDDTLIRHEIEILTPDSVARYKEAVTERSLQQEAELQERVTDMEEALKRAQDSLITDTNNVVALPGFLLAITSGVSCILALSIAADPLLGISIPFVAAVLLGGLVGVLTGLTYLLIFQRYVATFGEGAGRKKIFTHLTAECSALKVLFWERVPLAQYPIPMPPQEVFKLRRLLDDLQDATFFVHGTKERAPEIEFDAAVWKWERPEPVQWTFDPFIEVCLGDARHFIAVWDETDYEPDALQDH